MPGFVTPGSRERFRARCRVLHPEVYPERNRTIEEMLAGGMSYGHIADRFCISRNTVAGVASRMRRRAPVSPTDRAESRPWEGS